jgi:hypothetical protein
MHEVDIANSKIRKMMPSSVRMETSRRNRWVSFEQLWNDFLTSRKVFKGKMLLYLAYQSIGVIYGDIGTSPLYVYSSTFTSEPSHEDLIGVLSGKWYSHQFWDNNQII